MVCAQIASQYAGMVPDGAISCISCKKYDGVRVQYKNGSTARWLFSGVDQDQSIIYSVVSSKGNWDAVLNPEKLFCIRCDQSLPLDLILLSAYIHKTRR